MNYLFVSRIPLSRTAAVQAYLVLGEELITLNYVNVESPFSIDVPHRGTDEIRLMVRGYELRDTYRRYSGSFTADTSDIDLAFSTAGTVPSEWDSGLDMTGPRTFSWNPAGNANAYRLDILGVGDGEGALIAYIEGTSLTIDGSIDLSSIVGASITPIWTEGYLGLPEAGCGFDLQLTPASLISGTTVFFDSIMSAWSPPD